MDAARSLGPGCVLLVLLIEVPGGVTVLPLSMGLWCEVGFSLRLMV